MRIRIPFLKNFRRGFATNSSSSHSFVYLKEPIPGAYDDSGISYDEFEWNDFRLDTIKEKLFYVLTDRIGGEWQPTEDDLDRAYEDYHEEFPELSRDDFRDALNSHVDHQSRGTIDVDLARDPHVMVFGGNDNDGESWERAQVVASGQVDWDKTTMEWQDYDNISENDEAGQKLLKRQNRW